MAIIARELTRPARMELQSSLTINGKRYEKGDQIPWYFIYPFFMVHMGRLGCRDFSWPMPTTDRVSDFSICTGGSRVSCT